MSLLRQQRRNIQTTKIMTQYDYRILLTFPFAVCSAADLNISLSLSEQDLTLPGAVRVIDKEKS